MEGLIWVFLGVLLSMASVSVKLGDFHNPGPGFMPFVAGVFFVVSGTVLAVQLRSQNLLHSESKWNSGKPPSIWNRKELLITLLALLGYIVLLAPLGFLLTTFFFLFLLFKITKPRKWLTPLSSSLFLTIMTYVLFDIWLKCRFPKGIFKGIIS